MANKEDLLIKTATASGDAAGFNEHSLYIKNVACAIIGYWVL
jgi:hypothetical protein